MDTFAAAGLGLDYGEIRLVPAREEWLALGAAVIQPVAKALDGHVVTIEHVGSSAVPGLLSKPILDLAVGTASEPAPGMFTEELGEINWEYRGDAHDKGGLVFVHETRPLRRVAHIHVVRLGGPQWRNYLTFRDRLRTDPEALARYESEKRSFVGEVRVRPKGVPGRQGHDRGFTAEGSNVRLSAGSKPRLAAVLSPSDTP